MDGLRLNENVEGFETILGVNIKKNLKWTNHIEALKGKLRKRIAGVYKIRNCLLKIIAEGWLTSVLIYCLPLYGGCTQHEVNDLQVIQNKIARIVTRSKYRRNRTEMFDGIKWITVKQLTIYHTLMTIYRIRRSGEPEYLSSDLCNDNTNAKIIIPMSNLTLYRQFFIYRGIQNWNSLPGYLRSIKDYTALKRSLRQWIHKEVEKF